MAIQDYYSCLPASLAAEFKTLAEFNFINYHCFDFTGAKEEEEVEAPFPARDTYRHSALPAADGATKVPEMPPLPLLLGKVIVWPDKRKIYKDLLTFL